MEGLVVEVVALVEEVMVVEALGFEVDVLAVEALLMEALEMEALMMEGLMNKPALCHCPALHSIPLFSSLQRGPPLLPTHLHCVSIIRANSKYELRAQPHGDGGRLRGPSPLPLNAQAHAVFSGQAVRRTVPGGQSVWESERAAMDEQMKGAAGEYLRTSRQCVRD
ncbi:unnamed protein product [Arctogadus glacialis]